MNESETIAESERVSRVYSTYSEEEIAALTRRLEECRKRFIAEGDGKQRRVCVCSVIRDAADGNGGELPVADNWWNIAAQEGCFGQ